MSANKSISFDPDTSLKLTATSDVTKVKNKILLTQKHIVEMVTFAVAYKLLVPIVVIFMNFYVAH